MNRNPLKLFALNRSADFGRRVADAIGIPLAAHEEREFEDGEHKARPLESVRNADAFVIHSLYSETDQSANDKLIRLLFFLGTLKDAGAARVIAVIPYLCYARKDRRTKPRDPLNTRYVAALLESVGTDGILTLDVHNLAAYQNAFRCPAEHLEAKKLFLEPIVGWVADRDAVVVSPDVGGIKRAEQFREALETRLGRFAGSAFMEKKRSAGVVSGDAVVGDVEGRVAIIIDDLIASGGTIARTVAACHERGAASVLAAASHGLFAEGAGANLARPELERLLITDSIPPFRAGSRATRVYTRPLGAPTAGGRLAADSPHDAAVRARVEVVSAAPLFGRAIEAMHTGRSIVDLLAVQVGASSSA